MGVLYCDAPIDAVNLTCPTGWHLLNDVELASLVISSQSMNIAEWNAILAPAAALLATAWVVRQVIFLIYNRSV